MKRALVDPPLALWMTKTRILYEELDGEKLQSKSCLARLVYHHRRHHRTSWIISQCFTAQIGSCIHGDQVASDLVKLTPMGHGCSCRKGDDTLCTAAVADRKLGVVLNLHSE